MKSFRGFGVAVLLAGGAMGTVALPSQAIAQAARSHDIPAGPLASALNRFADESGVRLVYDASLTTGLSTRGLKGSFGPAEALSQLLAGTGLTFRQTGSNAFTIERAPQSADGVVNLGPVRVEGANSANASFSNRVNDVAQTEGTRSFTTPGTLAAATGLGLSLRETPQSVSVITRERMDQQGITTLGEVLTQTPGVYSEGDSGRSIGNRSAWYARGQSIEAFQIDGVPTSTDTFASNYMEGLSSINSAIYDSVTIVRGATGLLTGAGNPGGVINLSRKRPTENLQVLLEGSAASWNQYRAMADVGGPVNADGSIRARAVVAYDTAKSWVERYSGNKTIAYGIIEADLGERTLLTLTAEHSRQNANDQPWAWFGIPVVFSDDGTATPPSRKVNAAAPWAFHKTRRTGLTAILEHKLSDDWGAKVTYMRNNQDIDLLRSFVFALNREGFSESEAQRIISDGTVNTVDARINGKFNLFGHEHQLLAGINYTTSSHDFSDAQTQYFTDGAHWQDGRLIHDTTVPDFGVFGNPGERRNQKEFGAFLTGQFEVADGLSFILGGRLSSWKTKFRILDASPSYDPADFIRDDRTIKGKFTPYAAVTYDVTGNISAYASYTEIFNPQSARDVNGNVLDPEIGSNYEVGLKGEWIDGRLNASAAVFWTNKDNLAIIDDENVLGPTGDPVARAEDDTATRGWEVEIGGELLPGWQIQGGYTRAISRDSSDGRLMTFVPVNQAKVFTSYTPQAFQYLTLGGGINWQSSVFYPFPFNAPEDLRTIKGYAIANLMARYALNSHLNLTVNVNNVFDTTYRTASSQQFGAPRNVMATLRAQF